MKTVRAFDLATMQTWVKYIFFNLINLIRAVRCKRRKPYLFFRRWASSIMLLKPLMYWRDWTQTRSTGKEREGPVSGFFSKSSLVTSQGWTRHVFVCPKKASFAFNVWLYYDKITISSFLFLSLSQGDVKRCSANSP